jgi:hypothetical protein
MKYYAEILDNIIINLGTYDNELPEGMVDLHEQHYHTVFCGKTQYTELPEIVVEEPTPIPVEVVDDVVDDVVEQVVDDVVDDIIPIEEQINYTYEDIEAAKIIETEEEVVEDSTVEDTETTFSE